MNEIVSKLVDLLFEGIEMTDEVRAVHDEVMRNCQDRYDSMIRSGSSDDEAVGAVAESLRGMEDMLRDYPRQPQGEDTDPGRGPTAFGGPETAPYITWDTLRSLRVDVRTADISVFVSDGKQSLRLDQGRSTLLEAHMEGSTLVIGQHDRTDGTTEYPVPGGGFLSALARVLGSAVRAAADDDCRVVIELPAGLLRDVNICTVSGDIRLEVPAEEIRLQTTSGDCDVEMYGGKDYLRAPSAGDGTLSGTGADCGRLKAMSISGDLDVRGTFLSADLTTTSGDIDFAGGACRMKLCTVSGDIDAETRTDRAEGSTVSGDISVALNDTERAEVDLKTVSGDAELSVPTGTMLAAEVQTRSGSVEYSGVYLSDGAPLRARISTVSGDVSVCGNKERGTV